VDGQSRAIPGGVGLVDPTVQDLPGGLFYNANTCFYWLHTRAGDGVIQVETPKPGHYTLGDFFAIWHQPLTRREVASAVGRVTARVNGRLWRKPLREIQLAEHAEIELAVGKPVPRMPPPTDWTGTGF
jgi:hypothetical protein